MPPRQEDDTGALERARERIYTPDGGSPDVRTPLSVPSSRELPHAWVGETLSRIPRLEHRHVRLARTFLIWSFGFFVIALAAAGYFFYFGGNSISVDKIGIDIQGPTTISGGDVVPLSITITNKNTSAIEDAVIEINFPEGTRSADNVLQSYPRYTENLGTLKSGETVTRSIKAIIFGGAGQALSLPVSFSFGTAGASSMFVKKSAFLLAISSTPLSLSVDTLTETVSGAPITITLDVHSNATVPISNVVLEGAFPFGFSVTSSSIPINNSSFLLGTIKPGDKKSVTLTGVLVGQDSEQRVFNFTVGTAKTATDQTLSVVYMKQGVPVSIRAPFINATLALNGNTGTNLVISPGNVQNVSISYTNTLATSVTNAVVTVAISGSAIDYNSVLAGNGFYNSSNHTVVFSRDTDPSLAQLAPDASGIGTFTFSTLPAGSLSVAPSVIFKISVSGTRIGQSNVPENVTSTVTKTAKVLTTAVLSSYSLHTSGQLVNSGPIPPRSNQATTYSIVWNVQNTGNAIAGGIVSAILPSYVSYTKQTAGSGVFSYDEKSRTVTWNTGDLGQNSNVQGTFQISITPSTSQKGSSPSIVGTASFSGYDRFAGVQISAKADPVTTDTSRDPGYVPGNATVQ